MKKPVYTADPKWVVRVTPTTIPQQQITCDGELELLEKETVLLAILDKVYLIRFQGICYLVPNKEVSYLLWSFEENLEQFSPTEQEEIIGVSGREAVLSKNRTAAARTEKVSGKWRWIMKPLYLRLEGFKGIEYGLGMSVFEYDFSQLPDGLVAIFGDVGKGKSTILDNLHPYRIMPSKTESYSARSFNLANQMVSGFGSKIFRWLHSDGRLFESELVFPNNSSCYLFVVDQDGTKTPYVSEDGSIRCDGKLSRTTKRLSI